MSLLKLKSKTEPLYTNKKIINYDEKINKEIIEFYFLFLFLNNHKKIHFYLLLKNT